MRPARQGVERRCGRRKQADKTVEQGRLMTKGGYLKRTQGALEFEGVLKVKQIWDKKPEEKADEGS